MWQCIRHQVHLEDFPEVIVTKKTVHDLIEESIQMLSVSDEYLSSDENKRRLKTAAKIFEEIVTKHDFPEFITSYLYDEHIIRVYHNM